jgi:DNA-binding transcriptional MerR regulator
VTNNQIYLIKDLARLSGLSVYTIKYYLKIGLIKEIGRSPETSFRYFDDSTLEALRKIIDYKKSGVSLAKIDHLLAEGRHR